MTKVNVNGRVLTVEERVVQVSKSGSPLPADIIGAKGSSAKVVADKISAVADQHFTEAGLDQRSNERPELTGTAPDEPIPVSITQNGNLVFSGRLDYTGSDLGEQRGKEHAFDLSGDGLLLWPSLEGFTLRDLDLGTVVWDEANVFQSWMDNADDQPGIFAPAVFGDIEGGIFTTELVRYHVYFAPIVKAIFEQIAKYTVQSEFFETDLFKSCAHTFGVGDAMETASDGSAAAETTTAVAFNSRPVTGSLNPVPFDGSTNSSNVGEVVNASGEFTAAATGRFSVTLSYTATSNLSAVNLYRGSQQIASLPNAGTSAEATYELSLTEGDTLHLEAIAQSGTATLQSVNFDVTLNEVAGAARILTVSSCLPARPVKDFLRGVAHLFNLEFGADSTLRTVVIEPRFAYQIGGVTHPGYYDLTNVRPMPGFWEGGAQIKAQKVTGYPARLELGFKSSLTGMAEYYDEQLPDVDAVPVNGVRFSNGAESSETKTVNNPYFEAIRARNYDGTSEALALPHLWRNRTAEQEDGIGKFTFDPPTYEFPPSCGLVQRESTSIIWNEVGNNLRAPLLAQSLSFDNVEFPFVLAYGDQATFLPGRDAPATVYPGCGTTFYQHLASTLLRGRTVQGPARITNALDVYREDFRKAVALRYDHTGSQTSILLSIKNYQPGGLGTLSFLTFVGAGFLDSARTQHYGYTPLVTDPDNAGPCDYTVTDEHPHTDGQTDKPITAVVLQSGYTLALGYPYRSTTPGDAERLRADLDEALRLIGLPAETITVTISSGDYTRYTISIEGTRAWLRGVKVTSNARPVLINFDQTC